MQETKNFILNIPEYLKPSYRISPFRTSDVANNYSLATNNSIKFKNYLETRFRNDEVVITENGRSALSFALESLGLKRDDVVTIFTTTNSFYISGCVTQEIEKHCTWSRILQKNTKALLINHEFGFCSQDMKYYKSLNIPIIEDFAHSFVSDTENREALKYSDFAIFSLSKFFPIQVGGLLVCKKNEQNILSYQTDMEDYISNVCSFYIESVDKIKAKRTENYNYYKKLFNSIYLEEFFNLKTNDCPGVFCFKIPADIDFNSMKTFINSHGIESSVFYGENAYFVPCHQNLEKKDIDYIFNVVAYFLKEIRK